MAIKLNRRRFLNHDNLTASIVEGVNSVALRKAKKLIEINMDITGLSSSANLKKLILRGKNLFNPAKPFQPSKTFLGSRENLIAGLEAGQRLFYGIGATLSDGVEIGYSVRNQCHAVIPIKENKTYCINKFIKSGITLLDENFCYLNDAKSKVVNNDCGAKYLFYYCFNHAQSTSAQPWTYSQVLEEMQIEEGETSTEYQNYFEPTEISIPNYVPNNVFTQTFFTVQAGDKIKINYLFRKVYYNNVNITGSDFANDLLSITCSGKDVALEVEGLTANLNVRYLEEE